MNNDESCITVFVTPQSSCTRLIEQSAEIASAVGQKEAKKSI